MDIKYAVVSSNSNREYLDFWPYVAREWKKIGIETVIFYMGSENGGGGGEKGEK